MSAYVFDPLTRELQYSKPSGVQIPASAFDLNASTLYIQPRPRTSGFLIALVITLIVLLIIALIYLGWLIFVKTVSQSPADFFGFITGR